MSTDNNQVVSLARSRSISYATGKGRTRAPPQPQPQQPQQQQQQHQQQHQQEPQQEQSIRSYTPLHSTLSTDSIATRNSIHSSSHLSNLFEGTSLNTESIPGNLHVSSNRSIEHLVKRYGAVTLIRQLSTDLAQREAEMLLTQRRNAYRENAMMRLLNEVGFSSSEVESRIKEKSALETTDNEQYLKDLIIDAMEETLEDNSNGMRAVHTSTSSASPKSSGDTNTTLTPERRTRPHSLSSPPVPTTVNHNNSNRSGSSESHYDIFQGNILNVVSHKFLNHVPQPVHDVIVSSNTNSKRLELLEMESMSIGSHKPVKGDKEGYIDQFGFLYDKNQSQPRPNSSTSTQIFTSATPLQSKLLSLAQGYDKNKQQSSNQWDEFIKKITLLDNTSHEDLLMINGENISHYKHLYNELTRLVQIGIPPSLRPKIWTELCDAKTLRNPTEYESLLNCSEPNVEAESQIELDLYRTMPFNVFFKDNGPGLGRLQRVLIAFARKYTHIGYCQGMNFIVANLLLVYHNDEDVFWTFVGLFENILPYGFFNLSHAKHDMNELKSNFKEQLPRLHEHFQSCDVELEPICFNWFISLFTDSLSAHLVFRIWDNLMLNGYTEIHKTSLALFKIFEEKLMNMDANVEIYEFMKNLNKSNFNLRGSDLIKISSVIKI